MKKSLLVMFSFALASCGESRTTRDTKRGDLYAKCTSADTDQTRCTDTTLETCDGAVWRTTRDCAASGQQCVTSTAGANCASNTGGCTDGTTRCMGTVLQSCSLGEWMVMQDCASTGQTCASGLSGAACAAAPSCSHEGTQRCDGEVLQACTSGNWLVTEDCALSGKECVAGSVPNTASCVAPAAQHDFQGYTPAASATVLFYDDDLTRRHTLSSEDSPTSATTAVALENWVGYPGALVPGQLSTQELSGDNAAYDTCATCIIGARSDGWQTTFFLGTAGTVSGTLPATIGGGGSVTLSDVVLRELDSFTFQVVSGGLTWLISSVTLGAASSSRYPCDYFTFGGQELTSPGQSACAGLSLIAKCNANTELEGDSTCVDAMQKCTEPTQNTTACAPLSCQDPVLAGPPDYRTSEDETICWDETRMAVCTGGNLAPGTDCGASQQACADSAEPGQAACQDP